ncbi:hypothetical protein [Paenarthrobacter sp. C1]|uniref:hypothetical protein n=1 Tax=Paenarthrobacter sp. C1 TaxID=3400220 RepID=UPI003BF4A648
MAYQGTMSKQIVLNVTLAVIVIAIAAGVVLGVMTSSRNAPVAAVSTSTPEVPATVNPTRSTTTPSPSPVTFGTPAATATTTPRPVTAPSSAPPLVPEPEPSPARPVAPAQRQCPTGPVTANLTSVDIAKADASYSADLTQVTVTGHGTLVNGSNAAISVGENDIPNFLGLDDRGQSIVIELYGTFDWAPPPGQPTTGEFILKSGQSVNYTAVSKVWNHTVAEVKYWYSANVSGSLLLYFPSNIGCPVPVMKASEGKAIPNTFVD